MLILTCAPAAYNGGGNPRVYCARAPRKTVALTSSGAKNHRCVRARRALNVVFICLLLVASARFDLAAHDLVAVTESGKKIVIVQVEKDVEALAITFLNRGISMKDPVVDIAGLGDLTLLRDLSFYHVPQIASFEFLSDCVSIERLVISYARVRNVDFLSAMPNIELFHLEICDDWESDIGLPFLADPLDLSANNRLEYLAFRICNLTRVPLLVNVPEALKVLDISYNGIDVDERDTPALHALRRVERIFVNGNTVNAPFLAANKNLLFENSDRLLSEYSSE